MDNQATEDGAIFEATSFLCHSVICAIRAKL
jgi:hypothetical protein